MSEHAIDKPTTKIIASQMGWHVAPCDVRAVVELYGLRIELENVSGLQIAPDKLTNVVRRLVEAGRRVIIEGN